MDYGDLIIFNYSPVTTNVTGTNPRKVLVLHPNYQGKMHALKWDFLTASQQNMIRMLLDPSFAEEKKQSLVRQDPRSVQIFDAITQGEVTEDIRDPAQFYDKVIKQLIGHLKGQKQRDPYRQYLVGQITNSRTLTPFSIMTGKQKTFGRKVESTVHKLGKKLGLWESYVKNSRGTRGPRLPNRTPNFERKKR